MLSEAERLVFASCKTPMQQRMVTVGEGIQINTWTSIGNDAKPALVCMHGWTASCAFWHLTIDALAHHYKLYLADWVGFGRSSSVPSPADVVLNSASSCVFTRLWINTDEAM